MKEMYIKTIKKLGLCMALSGLLLIASCEQFLDVESTRVASEEGHWTTIEDTRAAVIGMYGLMKAALVAYNSYWIQGDLREGDFESFNRPDLRAVINSDLSASYGLLKDLTDWRRFYAVVRSANQLIERAPDVYDEDVRYTELNFKVDIAQARVMRAFAYFYMVRLWGDVPLITGSHDGSFEGIGRTSQEKVLAFAKSELLKAVDDLPFRYGANDPKQPGPYYGYASGRWVSTLFSSLAAYGLLAHISAWQGDYEEVLIYTNYIIQNHNSGSSNYMTTDQLVDRYFRERMYNQLISFTFLDGHGEATFSGHLEQLTLAEPLITRKYPDIYVSKDSINNIFVSRSDERFGFEPETGLPTTAYFINYNGDIPVFKKVAVVAEGISDGSFAIFESTLAFFRLEELTLLRAEAFAVLGLDEDAIIELNKIKSRRGVPEFKMGDGDVFDAVFEERRRELMGEGWRWYDLVRYHRIKRSDPYFNELIDNGGIYWPINPEVIAKNPLIEPNTYWSK